MTRPIILLLLFAAFLPHHVHAEILFEAFYRIERRGQHSGYVVQRVARDSKGFKTVSTYVRTKQAGEEVFVTSKATAKGGQGLPVETTHFSNNTGAPYKISAKFKNGKGTVTFHSTSSRKPVATEKAKPAPFPSSFLFYAGDLTKMETGKKYLYTAFAEESGRTQVGHLTVLAAKDHAGKKFLQLLNDDSGQPVENFVNENGEPLGSRSSATDTIAYWVPGKEEAVGELAYPTGEMTALFGDLPQGKKNPWSKAKDLKAYDVIRSFITWESSRVISSQPSGAVLPLPVRAI